MSRVTRVRSREREVFVETEIPLELM